MKARKFKTKRKPAMLLASLLVATSLFASTGIYVITTCGKGMMTISQGSLSDKEYDEFLLGLNEALCGESDMPTTYENYRDLP